MNYGALKPAKGAQNYEPNKVEARLSKATPHASNITPDLHLKYFADFCRNVQEVGGATPHLTMVGETCRDAATSEILWRGGCYAGVYNFAGAEVIWRTWQPGQILANPGAWAGWVKSHWAALPLRKERKAVNNPDRFAECMLSFAEWQQRAVHQAWWHLAAWPPPKSELYDQAWESFTSVRFMGRYIAIRFLEYMKRYLNRPALVMPDMRPADAPYPRQSLSLMYPEYTDVLRGNNSPENIRLTHQIAADCMRRLLDLHGVALDYYTLQSLLCEYKQSVLGRRQYPGRSVDSELSYWNKVYRRPEFESMADGSQMWAVRRASFPAYVLGELQGWAGARDSLGRVLTDHGYTWSDRQFDYVATTDLANPTRRPL